MIGFRPSAGWLLLAWPCLAAESLTDAMYRAALEAGLASANQIQIQGRVLSYVTRDSLYLAGYDLNCPLLPCGECPVRRVWSSGWPLPGVRGAEPPPFRVWSVAEPEAVGSRLRIAIGVLKPGRLYELSYSRLPEAAMPAVQASWDSTELAAPVRGLRPTLLAPYYPDAPMKVLAAFAGGWLRQVTRPGGAVSAQGRPDSIRSLGEDLVAYGERWYGSTAGKLYNLSDYGPLEGAADLGSGPVLAIQDSAVIHGLGGLSLMHRWRFSSWPATIFATRFMVPPASYLGLRIVRDTAGKHAVLYPAAGPARVQFLHDSATHVAGIVEGSGTARTPDHFPLHFREGSGVLSLKVALADAEGNFTPPSVAIRQDSTMERPLLDNLVNSDPAGTCASEGYCLRPDSSFLELVIDEDSIRVSLPVRGYVPPGGGFPGCPGQVFRDRRMTARADWRTGDLLRIRVGSQNLLVHYGPGPLAARDASAPGAGEVYALDRRAGLRAWPAGVRAGRGEHALVYRADGTRIGRIGLGEPLTALPAGLAWVRWPGASRAGGQRVLLY